MEGCAPFSAIEQQLHDHYQPASGYGALRLYTQALVWCCQRMRVHQRDGLGDDLIAQVVIGEWATRERRDAFLRNLVAA
jgi:hypothetical protein